MKVKYTHTPENESFVARATGRETNARFKDCVEICAAIKDKKAKDAESYLQSVLDGKGYIPIKKSKRQHGHTPGMKPYGGRPEKAVGIVLEVLKSAIANAEFKGLDLDNCIVISAVSQRGHKMKRMKPKGRHTVYERYLTTIQIILEELSE